MQTGDEPVGRRGLLSALAGRRSPRAVVFRPPWSIAREAFVARCTGCGSCIDACPARILELADDGKAALNFEAGGCDFCGKCAQACKERCFEIVAGRPALDFVAHVGPSCLEPAGISCRLCEDSCPVSALRARPVGGGRRIVVLDAHACTGCGTCVAVCPPHAITIAARDQTRHEARS